MDTLHSFWNAIKKSNLSMRLQASEPQSLQTSSILSIPFSRFSCHPPDTPPSSSSKRLFLFSNPCSRSSGHPPDDPPSMTSMGLSILSKSCSRSSLPAPEDPPFMRLLSAWHLGPHPFSAFGFPWMVCRLWEQRTWIWLLCDGYNLHTPDVVFLGFYRHIFGAASELEWWLWNSHILNMSA